MESRDNDNIRHFKARSTTNAASTAADIRDHSNPVQVFLVFDQGFGSQMDQLDETRFKYTGTSPQVSRYGGMCARRNLYNTFDTFRS